MPAWFETQLYIALRGVHAKMRLKATTVARQAAAQAQSPKTAGDMGVKGNTAGGKLIYMWEGREVEVTPRDLRPAQTESMSVWKAATARETTPERALRKMVKKVKHQIAKAARGEHERIVAREPSADACALGAESEAGRTTAACIQDANAQAPGANGEEAPKTAVRDSFLAMAKLDDEVVLAHLRATYVFLGSATLHHCGNCDEQWVIFGGVAASWD